MIAVAQRIHFRLRQQLLQPQLALNQRQIAHVLAIEAQKIEGHENDFARAGLERADKRAEIGQAMSIEDDSFAVDDRILYRKDAARHLQSRESVRSSQARCAS